jgi:hypothetical protein
MRWSGEAKGTVMDADERRFTRTYGEGVHFWHVYRRPSAFFYLVVPERARPVHVTGRMAD